jgi:hypothetical protein
VVLFRQAAAEVPEVAHAEVSTLRQRLWKAPAVVVIQARRVLLGRNVGWPFRAVFGRVVQAVAAFVARLTRGQAGGLASAAVPM